MVKNKQLIYESAIRDIMMRIGLFFDDVGVDEDIQETKNPAFSMLSSVKCRNSQEINDFSTLSDTLFYPLSQNQKYLQSGFHPNPEGYRKSTVRLDNC